MRFDKHGHVKLTPQELHKWAVDKPKRLIDDILLHGTPAAFKTYARYCDFLAELGEKLGVHSRNLFIRGSCGIGYSIAPQAGSAWMAMDDRSDLDLAIVDSQYYDKIDQEIQEWEARIRPEHMAEIDLKKY